MNRIECKVLTWPPNTPEFNLIKYLWNVLEKQVQSKALKLEVSKNLMLKSWCQIPQDNFRGLVESMPPSQSGFGGMWGDLHNIRQVVML